MNLCEIDPKNIPKIPWKDKSIKVYIYSVYDGDTLKFLYDCNGVIFKMSLRIEGVDTPEIRTSNELEKRAAYIVRDYIKSLYNKKEIFIIVKCWDKYGGRIIGRIIDEKYGDITEHLIKLCYAKKYDGGTKSKWTDKELTSGPYKY